MTWGPFLPGLDPPERKARLRCLRLATKLVCGPRSIEARHAMLVAQIDPDEDTLALALAEFGRLGSIDQRRVLSAYAEVA